MVLTYSQEPEIGKSLPNFSLPATDSRSYGPEDFKDKKILVIVFTCNHCPYAKLAKPKLIHLFELYQDKGVQFITINPNDSENYPEDSFDKMKEKKNDYPFPYLRDESQEAAKNFSAVCTPDIFIYDQQRKIAYHGQLDDERPEKGVALEPNDPKYANDIRRALNRLIKEKPAIKKQKPCTGCSIKWKM